MINAMIDGLQSMMTLYNILMMVAGTALGVTFGAIPGLTGGIAIAVCLPLTFYLDVYPAMALLIGIYVGGSFGGSIPAVLLGVPGAPEAGITVLDGAPMSKKGQSGKALLTALYASCAGNFLSALITIVMLMGVSKIALMIGPAEFVGILFFSLVLIATVGSSGNSVAGLLAAFVGLLLSMIGTDPVTGIARFTFGRHELLSGLELIPVLIGLFVGSELLGGVRSKRQTQVKTVNFKDENRLTKKEVAGTVPAVLSGSVIGSIIGALPGLNAAVSATLNYSFVRRFSKNGSAFGTGCVEGIAASEAANNGTVGPTLVPLLTLGIPGSGTAAIFLGALLMQGVICGPTIMTDSGNVVYGIFFALLFCTITLAVIGRLIIRIAQNVIFIPTSILTPLVIFMCCVGVYSNRSLVFDIYVLIAFMLLGYLMKLGNIPVLPLLIAYLLGSTLEAHFRRALTISQGKMSIFFRSPICVIFLLISAALLAYSILSPLRNNKKKGK